MRNTAGLALSIALSQQGATAAVLDLGVATNFGVLAGAGITIAAPVNSTEITGDIGSFATTTITGLENLVLFGTNHGGDAVTQQGKLDLSDAYDDAEGQMADVLFPLIHDIGGMTLSSGVYQAPSSLFINGVLTLDGGGDPNAFWVFQVDSTLITGSASRVELINGAQVGNVFWQVGSSATLGVGSSFQGTILARESITMNTSADMIGRALALDGAVTLDNNRILVPEPGSTLLVAAGVILLAMKRRRNG